LVFCTEKNLATLVSPWKKRPRLVKTGFRGNSPCGVARISLRTRPLYLCMKVCNVDVRHILT
jgi:hypothetical protein